MLNSVQFDHQFLYRNLYVHHTFVQNVFQMACKNLEPKVCLRSEMGKHLNEFLHCQMFYLRRRSNTKNSILMTLFEIMKCSIYLLYISYFTSKYQIGSFDNIVHSNLG